MGWLGYHFSSHTLSPSQGIWPEDVATAREALMRLLPLPEFVEIRLLEPSKKLSEIRLECSHPRPSRL